MALSVESKVGVFFIIALIALGIITFQVEDLGKVFKRRYVMYAQFNHASGINPGDTVAIAGVKVGEVKSLELRPDSVIMTLNIESKDRIRKDAVATIAWGGLLGNRYIDITLGSPDAPFLDPKSTIETKPGIEITQVLQKIDTAASTLQALLQSEEGSKFGGLITNLFKISDDIAQGKGTLGKLVGSAEMYEKAMGIADDLKDASARVKKILADNEEGIGKLMESLNAAVPEAKEAFASINKIGEQVESGKGLLPALLNDEKMYNDFKDSLAKLNTSLDSIEQFTKDVREGKGLIARLVGDEKLSEEFAQTIGSLTAIAKRLESGDSTLARLTRDDDLYVEAKKLVEDARETVRSLKEQVPLGTFGSVLLSAF